MYHHNEAEVNSWSNLLIKTTPTQRIPAAMTRAMKMTAANASSVSTRTQAQIHQHQRRCQDLVQGGARNCHTTILWNSCNKQWQNYWPVYSFWVGNRIESNVRVCAALKWPEVEGHVPQCPMDGDANDANDQRNHQRTGTKPWGLWGSCMSPKIWALTPKSNKSF